jgi:hypothetical protein
MQFGAAETLHFMQLEFFHTKSIMDFWRLPRLTLRVENG